ncbi:hypothetical protein [Streptomyces sp. URMC 123]|uniref:hypothetical protein n=1 Tax=Streptomyces sp. URMC 123 TaxID=3423403 RepID=UPI003F1AA070
MTHPKRILVTFAIAAAIAGGAAAPAMADNHTTLAHAASTQDGHTAQAGLPDVSGPAERSAQ